MSKEMVFFLPNEKRKYLDKDYIEKEKSNTNA